MRIFLSLVTIILFAINMQAQLNDYKYVVIPKKFDAFKRQNQYQTSTLIKHMFGQKGFNAIYDDELPQDLAANQCLGLTVKLDDQSSMFTTKTVLILEDCTGKSIFFTQEGKSREKDYQISYKEAISEAFNSIEALNYAYSVEGEPETVTLSYKNDIKDLNKRSNTENTARDNRENMVRQEATVENQSYESSEPVNSNYIKAGSPQAKSVENQVATNQKQSYDDGTKDSVTKPENLGVLYAQELPSGYQLVDSSPKVVMILYKTSMKDVYAAKFGAVNGLVFKKDGKWLFDYTEGTSLIQKELNIKF